MLISFIIIFSISIFPYLSVFFIRIAPYISICTLFYVYAPCVYFLYVCRFVCMFLSVCRSVYMPPVYVFWMYISYMYFALYVCPLCILAISPYIRYPICMPRRYILYVYVSNTSPHVYARMYAPYVCPLCIYF